MSDSVYDVRLIAQTQLANIGSGNPIQPIIQKWVKEDGKVDESKVAILCVGGYQVFDKQEIANAFQGFLVSSDS